MHVVVAVILGQVHQHSGGAAAVAGPTEAAVADASAGRTEPLLSEERHTSQRLPSPSAQADNESGPSGPYRVEQGVSDVLPVAVLQAGPAELAPHSHTLLVAAVGFGVSCLLAALVAGASLKRIRRGEIFNLCNLQ